MWEKRKRDNNWRRIEQVDRFFIFFRLKEFRVPEINWKAYSKREETIISRFRFGHAATLTATLHRIGKHG